MNNLNTCWLTFKTIRETKTVSPRLESCSHYTIPSLPPSQQHKPALFKDPIAAPKSSFFLGDLTGFVSSLGTMQRQFVFAILLDSDEHQFLKPEKNMRSYKCSLDIEDDEKAKAILTFRHAMHHFTGLFDSPFVTVTLNTNRCITESNAFYVLFRLLKHIGFNGPISDMKLFGNDLRLYWNHRLADYGCI